MKPTYEEVKQQVRAKYNYSGSNSSSTKPSYDEVKKAVKEGRVKVNIDDNYINDFMTKSQDYLKTLQESPVTSYSGVKREYESSGGTKTKLIQQADNIRMYLNANKNKISSDVYDSYSSYLNAFRNAMDQDTVNLKKKYDIISRFETEEDYNKAVKETGYREKYKDTDYNGLKTAISNFEKEYNYFNHTGNEGRKSEINSELEWLKSYISSRDVIDNMSLEELERVKNDKTAQSKVLNEEKQELQRQITKYRRGDRTYFKNQKEVNAAEEKIKELETQISRLDGNAVLYYDDEDMAMTLDNMIRIRTAETNISEIKSKPDTKKIYDELNVLEEDLDNIWNAINIVMLGYSDGSAYTGEDTIKTDRQSNILTSVTSKYDIDLGKSISEVEKELSNLYDTKEKEFKNTKTKLSQKGYNWDEISYFQKWQLDREKYVEEKKKNEQYAKDHPIMATIMGIVGAPGQIFDYAGNIADSIRGIGTEENSALRLPNIYNDWDTNAIQTMQSTVSNTVNEEVLKKTGSELISQLASGAYSGVTSSMQSAVTTAVCVAMFGKAAGSQIALGIMASEAAASQYNASIKNGSSSGEAVMTSVVAGAAEYFFEKLPMEHLFKMSEGWDTKSLSSYLKSVLKSNKDVLSQGLIEAMEETGTSFTNFVADEIINSGKSEYQSSINRYMQTGYSKEEAKQLADKDFWTGIFMDAFGGFVGGVFTGGAGNIVNTAVGGINTAMNEKVHRNQGKAIIKLDEAQMVIDYATNMESESVKKVLKGITSAEKVSPVKLGQIFDAVQSEIVKQISETQTGTQLKRVTERLVGNTNSGAIKMVVMKAFLNKMQNNPSFVAEMTDDTFEKRNVGSEQADGNTVFNEVVQSDTISQDEFIGEESGIRHSSEQAGLLSQVSDSALQDAFDYFEKIDDDIPLDILGIDPESDIYKKFKAAKLINPNGTVKGIALMDERSRRNSAQKQGDLDRDNVSEGDTDTNVGNGEITVNMTESERAEILRNKTVTPVQAGDEYNEDLDFAELETNIKSKVEKTLLKKLKELGFLKNYTSPAIDGVDFDFTLKGVRKSLHSQETAYGGSKADFAKAITHLQELLDNAVLIETHTDKGKGTDREQRGLQQVYVLLSTMQEGNTIIPVQFEVKQYIDNNNRLYLAVALTKIETGVVGNTASEKQMATSLLPVSTISISELFSKINPKDKNFLKYIPDEFLNEEQLDAKRWALQEDSEKYGSESDRDVFTNVGNDEIHRDMTEDDYMRLDATGEYRGDVQKQVESIAKDFGLKIRWSEKVSEGSYNFVTHTITMNPKLTLGECYMLVFKHEMVHYLESLEGYDNLKKYLFKSSVAFADYCQSKMRKVSGYEFKGTADEAIKQYTQYKYDQYKNNEELSELLRKRFTTENAEQEIVADFVAEMLLGKRNTKASELALIEMAKSHRNILQKIWDWIKDTLASIKKRGEIQNKTLEKDLEYLDGRIKRVFKSKEKKNFTPESEVKYSISRDEIFARYCDSIDQIEINDDISQKGEYVEVSQHTPSIIVEKANAKDLPMAILFDTAYLETRHNGKLPGNYHNLGADNMKNLPKLLETPEYIVKLANGRLNIIVDIATSKAKQTLVSIELNQSKQVKGKFNRYNLIITAFSTKSGYLDKIVNNPDNEVLYNKKTEPQGTDQLHKGLDGINDSVSNNRVAHNEPSVNNNSMQNTEKHSLGLANDVMESTDSIGEKLIAKHGEYLGGSEALSNGLESVIDLIHKNRWSDAMSSAQSVAKGFQGANVKIVADEIYNRIMDAYHTGVLSEIESTAEYNKRSEDKNEIQSLKKEVRKLKRQNEALQKSRNEAFEEERISRKEREDRTKNIEHIKRIVNRISTRFFQNSDKLHIPERLKPMVENFLKVFIDNDNKVFRRQDIKDLYDEYCNLAGNEEDIEINGYDEDVAFTLGNDDKRNEVQSLATVLDGRRMRDLSLEESQLIRDVVDNIWHMIKHENELFLEGRTEEYHKMGIEILKSLKDKDTKKNLKVLSEAEGMLTKNMTPVYFFEMLGGPLKDLFWELIEGQGKWARNFETSKLFFEKMKSKYRYSEWVNETITLTTKYGDELSMTVEQALQLYATARRQFGNKTQEAQHLNIGGVVLEDGKLSDSVFKQLKDAVTGKNRKLKSTLEKTLIEKMVDKSIQINYEDILKLDEVLTEDQKGYVKDVVEYLSTDMAKLGNEVSMKLHGIRKYTEKYYIPYQSAKDYLYSQPGMQNDDARIKNYSFTKSTVKKANTPLVLTSFSEVCANHINKMCMYNALAIPLDNLNRVFNYKTTSEEGLSPTSVKGELQRTYGADVRDYIKQFIEDANGSVRISSTEQLADSLIALHKKGAVAASLSVAIQQPSSIVRAMAYIDPKYFIAKGADYEELCEYAPVAIIKRMGRFDTGLGISDTKWVLGHETFKDKLDDKFSLLASKADEITWARIWAAVKAETKAESDLKEGSKEFLEHCGKRFTEVINFTQVYDSTFSRSQYMRDKGLFAKMVTSFMAEPTVSINMLINAVNNIKNGDKKFGGKAIASLVVSVLVNTALKSLVYAARDDDEEKDYWEKYGSEFVANFIQEINPLGWIPLIRDIVSLFDGYDVERADMSLISDLIASLKMIGNEDKSATEIIESFAGSLAAFLGVPVNNILRDIKGTWNVVSEIFNYENFSLMSDTDVYKRMIRAIENGDEETYEKAYQHLLEQGKTDSKILSGIKSRIKNSDAVTKEAEEIIDDLESDEFYSELDEEDKNKISSFIKGALSSEILDKMIDGDDAEYDRLYSAQQNNSKEFKKLKQKLLDNGVSESEINFKLFVAEIRYMESSGVDLKNWALAEVAVSKKHADTDKSGGVSKKEKKEAIKNLDVGNSEKKSLWEYYGLN